MAKSKFVLIFIIAIVLTLIVSLFMSSKKNKPQVAGEPLLQEASPTNKLESTPQPSLGKYSISYIIVRSASNISLHSNLSEKVTGKDLLINKLCSGLISGSFFTSEGKHIGLFIENGVILNKSSSIKTWNGYFYSDKSGAFKISSLEPKSSEMLFALQSGPLLILNKTKEKLESASSDHARRIVVAETAKNEAVFIVIYDSKNVISGPTLEELPKILEELSNKSNLKIVNALNLDGGSHSAFFTDDASMSEVSTIGSYFCIR
jgi:exopolysaccharide biosynthesis protein